MRPLFVLSLALVAASSACSRSGLTECLPADRVATGDASVRVALADDEYLFWFRTGESSALRGALRCGAAVPFTVTEESAARPLASGGGRLYFTDGEGSIRAVPRSGGGSSLVAAHAAPIAMAVSTGARGSTLFWMSAAGLFSLPLGADGQPPTALGPPGFSPPGTAGELAADESALYFLRQTSTPGLGPSLTRLARDGSGAALDLVPAGATPGSPAASLVLGGTELFFVALGGEVRAVSTSGGAPRSLVAYENPDRLAVTNQFVWWRNPATAGSATLRRVPRDGGSATTVASAPRISSPIAATDAVWFDDTSSLQRLPD